MGKPRDPQFEPHARIKMAQVLGSPLYICGTNLIHRKLKYFKEVVRKKQNKQKNKQTNLKNQAIFCNTSNQGGLLQQGSLVATPFLDFPNRTPRWNWFWYQYVGTDLLYSHIPKWVQLAKASHSYDVIKHSGPENCDILHKIGESSKFRYKSSEYQNFTGSFAKYKRKMVIPTCSVSFSIIACRYFSKWWINVFLKLKRLHPPPSPSDIDSLPYPRVRWLPPIFFHENGLKGCKRDNLYALGNFL